jgi:uncharacterized protein (DUF1015 family)
MKVEPFSCLRPAPDKAATVAAPPYDVFDRAEAAAYVSAHPGSFLAIDRPETQFDADHDPYAADVYAKAAALMDAALADGTYVPDPAQCYYLYRLEMAGHAQTGIVACCAVDDYLDGTIKRHENTVEAKETDRIRHIEALSAQTGPIFLAYRDDMALDLIVSAASAAEPLYDFTDDEGVRNTVWRIARPEAVEAIQLTFAALPCSYIADGHHRAASAVKASLARREAAEQAGNPDLGHDRPYDTFLSVLFPASQLEVLAYNRVVADRAGRTPAELIEAVQDTGFEVTPSTDAVEPADRGHFGLLTDGSWYELSLGEALAAKVEDADPVGRLDTSVLQEGVLSPILGITDPRRDPRIDFVGGIRGTDELERRAGTDGVAFSMHATSIDELMAVADAGLLMPPKSTWFEPKLRSGLFVHRL